MRGVLLNSFPPCHFHGFLACCRSTPPPHPSSVRPELLKSVVIPCMTVNLGLQLSTAQSHFACFSSVFLVFTPCFLEFSHQVRTVHRPAVLTPPKCHLGCPRGNFEMMNTKKRVVSAPSTPYYSCESEFRSGCFSQGIEKGGRDVFLSHHAPATGPKLAQRVGQFLQG